MDKQQFDAIVKETWNGVKDVKAHLPQENVDVPMMDEPIYGFAER